MVGTTKCGKGPGQVNLNVVFDHSTVHTPHFKVH